MKNGKRLTKKEKIHISTYKLNPENWLMVKKMSDMWIIVNKISNKTRQIPAP